MSTFGYIRVSTCDQNTDRQEIALLEAGVEKGKIFTDHWSGKDFDRPYYRKLMETIQAGDEIVIMSVDRMGRNYRDMVNEWRHLQEDLGVNLRVLDFPILNTSKDNTLTDQLISDIVLQLQSYVAESERDFILKRQKEGIAAAKLRGVDFGRPRISIPKSFPSVKKLWEKKKITSREAGEKLGVSHTTFMRWVKASTNA